MSGPGHRQAPEVQRGGPLEATRRRVYTAYRAHTGLRPQAGLRPLSHPPTGGRPALRERNETRRYCVRSGRAPRMANFPAGSLFHYIGLRPRSWSAGRARLYDRARATSATTRAQLPTGCAATCTVQLPTGREGWYDRARTTSATKRVWLPTGCARVPHTVCTVVDFVGYGFRQSGRPSLSAVWLPCVGCGQGIQAQMAPAPVA